MALISALLLASLLLLLLVDSAVESASGVNVVLIIVDDLRPALGCYGDSKAHTPHLDRLAKQGMLFERAYAQQALCAPSRNSLLTSRRPWSLRLYDTHSYWRESVGNFSTMPQYFKEHGYKTAAFGKIFHPGASSNHSDDSPYSWTQPAFHPYTERFKDAPLCGPRQNSSDLVCPVRVSWMPNATLPDMEIVSAAKNFLRAEAKGGPFFLAVGLLKPHIPLTHPKRYLKYHPISKFRVPSEYKWPRNLTQLAYNPWMDLRRRDDVEGLGLACPWQKIPRPFARRIMRSYYAAVTYVDELLGELLRELELLGHDDDSIVVLTSDHGWSLGEHAEWAKYSNFEVALRVPLLVKAPGRLPRASRVREPVELLDLLPTLAELAGLPVPAACPPPSAWQPRLCSQGRSLLRAPRKGLAVSLYPRAGPEPTCEDGADEPRLRDIRVMGYSVRSARLRYTAWLPFAWRENRPDWTHGPLAEELYDHAHDPRETNNLAAATAYQLHKQRLQRILIDTLET